MSYSTDQVRGSASEREIERELTVGDDTREEPEVVSDVELSPPWFAVAYISKGVFW